MSLFNKISKFLDKKDKAMEGKIRIHNFIAKRVKQNNTDIGEAVAVEETRFVIKNSGIYMSIPIEKIIANSEYIVVGDFNTEESLQLGKAWFERRDTLKFDENGMMVLNPSESQ